MNPTAPTMNGPSLNRKIFLGQEKVKVDSCDRKTMSLSSLGNVGLEDFFPIAINLTQYIADFHDSGNLHGKLSTANIHVGKKDAGEEFEVTVTDESSSAVDLCFISPEQTGRLQKRKVDERSDLYSLGVVFHFCLTGKLPFDMKISSPKDPMKIVHAHIARKVDADPSVPKILSDIVGHLLEKEPDDRYYSAKGLKLDLEQAYQCFQESKSNFIPSFPLRYHIGKFKFPSHLYGRHEQIQQLLLTLNRVSTSGALEVLLVGGYSGTGKTALVEKVHPTLRIAGKFDQSIRVPYHAIVIALENLVTWLLKQDESVLSAWKTRLQQSIGTEGKVVTDLVPRMVIILGEQPALPELEGKEGQNRFIYILRNFFRAICQPDSPLVLFMDDMQWADSGSLELLQALATDAENRYLLITLAYRDNEVSPSHPFMKTVDSIKESKVARVHTITVENLKKKDVQMLIADTLHSEVSGESNIPALTDLVYEKTRGNSFFTRQFLKELYDQKHLCFDWKSQHWRWDADTIQQLTSTDNVVDLMAKKIKRFDTDLQECLITASAIGARFDVTTVAAERDMKYAKALELLEKAREEGLLLCVPREKENGNFSFVHDRVQQAALSLLSETERPARHYRIGRIVFKRCKEKTEQLKHIFEIVDQLDRGLHFIKDLDESLQLAHLNLLAGERAKESAAYSPAYIYVKTGVGLLGEREFAWEHQYELSLKLYSMAADMAYMSAQFDKMDEALAEVFARARTLLERIPSYRIQILSFKARNKLDSAIDTGVDLLRQLGVEFPEATQENTGKELVKILSLLEGKTKEALLGSPVMTDPKMIAALKIMADINSSVYWSRAEFFPFIVFKSVELSVRFGNTEVSSFAYGTFGVILSGVVGDMKRAYEFGKLGIEVMEKFQAKEWLAQIYTPHYALIVHWNKHIRETFKPLIYSIHVGLETGAIEYAMINANIYCIHGYLSGQDMAKLESEIEGYSAMMQGFGQETNYNFNQIYHQAVLNMQGRSDDPCALVGTAYDEHEMLPRHLKANDSTASFFVYFNKMILNYLFGYYETAVDCRDETESKLSAVLAKLENTSFNFYDSLLSLALIRQDEDRKEELLNRVEKNQQVLKKWASDAPMNFLHKYQLVQAELARGEGNTKRANKLYKEAISHARENGFLNDEALANELAAECWFELDFEEIGDKFLVKAYQVYSNWGARAKTRQLTQKYPKRLRIYSESSESSDCRYMDLFSVMKSATAIQGEIILNKLLKKLMAVLIENAGADRGYLFLCEKRKLYLQAERHLGPGKSAVLQGISVEELKSVPQSVVSYVMRSQEPVVLDKATENEIFGQDPYILSHGTCSIHCFPIVHHGKLTGVVYLENSLVSGAFTEERTSLLNLLSGQIAISIHNALLHDRLDQKVKERTLALERQKLKLEVEKNRSDELLLNILPRQIAEELKKYNKAEARRHENVTILFSDIVNFTDFAAGQPPELLVKELDEYFGAMDEIVESYGLEKIKQIGDAYMCAAGVPAPDPAGALKMVKAAKEMLFFVENMKKQRSSRGEDYFDIRIGMHTGPVVAGVVGLRKFAYDLWGETVNRASRMESSGAPNSINISESVYAEVKDHVDCEYRGKVACKNMSDQKMYFVLPEERRTVVDMHTLMRRGTLRREELQGLLAETAVSEELQLFDDTSDDDSDLGNSDSSLTM